MSNLCSKPCKNLRGEPGRYTGRFQRAPWDGNVAPLAAPMVDRDLIRGDKRVISNC